jgi:hypothetical protein
VFSRVARERVETARVLLDHGADPNAGYLWEGLVPPFTALTGALDQGDEMALARLLLQRGADPNDGQAVYNNGGNPNPAWLALLLEFGFGRGNGGPWRRLLGDSQDSPQQMLEDVLMAAAGDGSSEQIRLLLEHGVDPDGTGSRLGRAS